MSSTSWCVGSFDKFKEGGRERKRSSSPFAGCKLCYVIGKYVCNAIGAVCKAAWKFGRFLYLLHQKKKAVVVVDVESSVRTVDLSSPDIENYGDEVTASVAGGGENE